MLICIGIVLVSVIIGSQVQKRSKFVLPKDIVSIFIFIFILSDLFIIPLYGGFTRSSPLHPDIDPLAYLSFLSGYWTGYYINGSQAWTMVCTFFAKIRGDDGRYTVLYEHKGTDCIADQNNWALLKRWIWGIHHKVDLAHTGAKSLRGKTMTERRRRPILKFKDKKLWLNSIDHLEPEIRILWSPKLFGRTLFTLKAKVFTTVYNLADANQAEQWEVVLAFDRMNALNDEISRLNYECEDLKKKLEIGITNGAVMLAADIKRGNPITRYLAERKKRAAEEEAEKKRIEEERKKAAEAQNKPKEDPKNEKQE